MVLNQRVVKISALNFNGAKKITKNQRIIRLSFYEPEKQSAHLVPPHQHIKPKIVERILASPPASSNVFTG